MRNEQHLLPTHTHTFWLDRYPSLDHTEDSHCHQSLPSALPYNGSVVEWIFESWSRLLRRNVAAIDAFTKRSEDGTVETGRLT